MFRNATRVTSVVGVAVLSLLSLGGAATAQQSSQGQGKARGAVIENVSSGHRLVPHDYGNNNSNEIQVWAVPQQTSGRHWNILPQGGNRYMIQNQDTKKCMAVSDVGAHFNRVVQRTCNHRADDQVWWIESEDGSRGSMIINTSTREAIVPFNSQPGTLSWAVLEDPTGVDTQLWRFSGL